MAPPQKIEKLEELIKGSIPGEIVEQDVQSLVPPGENFGSVIYKVDIKVKNEGKKKTYHTVAKCTPPNKVTQEMFNIQVTTKAEIGWYTNIIPTIKNFQRECGVEQIADFFQTFYGARINLDPSSDIVDINAVILTENLIPLGYHNGDRHIGFDLKVSKAVLRDLATLHAVPIAIKIKNHDLFDKNIKPFLTGLEPPKDESNSDRDPQEDIKNALKQIPEITPYMDRVNANLSKNKLGPLKSTTRESSWNSISHNDLWVNNLMIKEQDNPKTVFLDFQAASYDSIAKDVLFFLCTSVAREVITEYMDDLIKYYWNEFSKNLKQLEINDSSFTFEEFLKEMDEVASSGQFSHSLFFVYVLGLDKGHTMFDSSDENFKKEDMKQFNFSFNSRHKEKLQWLITEFVKRNWI